MRQFNDDTDKCDIEGHRYGCLEDHEGNPMCDRCGHVDRDSWQDDNEDAETYDGAM